jgi:hypothetical protein
MGKWGRDLNGQESGSYFSGSRQISLGMQFFLPLRLQAWPRPFGLHCSSARYFFGNDLNPRRSTVGSQKRSLVSESNM